MRKRITPQPPEYWRIYVHGGLLDTGKDYDDFAAQVFSCLRRGWIFDVSWHQTEDEAYRHVREEGEGKPPTDSKEPRTSSSRQMW